MTDTIRALTDPLRVKSVQWFFWAVAIVFYGFGDTITTIFGLQATGVAEGGPLVLVVLALGGIPAFFTKHFLSRCFSVFGTSCLVQYGTPSRWFSPF